MSASDKVILNVKHADNDLIVLVNVEKVWNYPTEYDPSLDHVSFDVTPHIYPDINTVTLLGINWGWRAHYEGALHIYDNAPVTFKFREEQGDGSASKGVQWKQVFRFAGKTTAEPKLAIFTPIFEEHMAKHFKNVYFSIENTTQHPDLAGIIDMYFVPEADHYVNLSTAIKVGDMGFFARGKGPGTKFEINTQDSHHVNHVAELTRFLTPARVPSGKYHVYANVRHATGDLVDGHTAPNIVTVQW